MYTYTPSNSVFYGHITNLLSILSILTEVLSRAHAKGQTKSPNDFRFGTPTGRFPSDGAASMAVKGLKSTLTTMSLTEHTGGEREKETDRKTERQRQKHLLTLGVRDSSCILLIA